MSVVMRSPSAVTRSPSAVMRLLRSAIASSIAFPSAIAGMLENLDSSVAKVWADWLRMCMLGWRAIVVERVEHIRDQYQSLIFPQDFQHP